MRSAPARTGVMDELERVLGQYMSAINARGVLRLALRRSSLSERDLEHGRVNARLVEALSTSVTLYVSDRSRMSELSQQIRTVLGVGRADEDLSPVTVEVKVEYDIVRVRGEARRLANQMRFPHTDQIKITTAVSELARNIFRYAGEGRVHLHPRSGPPESLEVVAEDEGPGIDNVDEILAGTYQSKTGLGRGLIGCRQLADSFHIETTPGKGTRIRLRKVRGR